MDETGLHRASDADLLAAAARRDAAAFSALVARHFALVYRVVWRQMKGHGDAEDVAQEAFLRLWRSPEQVKDGSALKGWLLRVASNLVIDRHRGGWREESDEADAIPDTRDDAEQALQRGEVTAAVDAAIAGLPERQRLALTLVHFEDLGNAAAAEVMGLSIEALESLLARARRGLKERLAPQKHILLAGLAGERI